MLLSALLALLVLDLSPQTAARLQVAWTYHTNAAAPNARAARIAAFEATPVLHNGLLYVITPFDQVIALDPETGVERWRFDAQVAKDRSYSEATSRGVTPAGNRLFFGTLDARLIALDASTGRLDWEARLGQSDGNFQVTSPPVVVDDTVITGSA